MRSSFSGQSSQHRARTPSADARPTFIARRRFPVIGHGVEQAGFPHAFAFVINDDPLHWPGALEPDVDRSIRQVPWRFKAERFEGERVVGTDVTFLFNEEQLIIGLVGREESNPFAIQRIAVDRTHAQDGMNLGVVLLFDPLGELAVERG